MRRDEPIVLLLGALEPQQIVEQQRLLVLGGDPCDLEAGPVTSPFYVPASRQSSGAGN